MKNVKSIISLLTYVNIFTLICTGICNAQSISKQSLLALSKANHTLSIVDASTLKVVATVPVGEDPHEIIASSDGKTAYVSIYGGGSLHTINVIDLVAQKRLKDIDTRPLFGPHGLTFVNNKLWFTVEGSKAIGSYNPSTDSIDWCMGTGQDRTHMIYVTNDAKKIYATNVASGTVSIIQDTLTKMGPMPPPPSGKIEQRKGQASPPHMMQSRHNWHQSVITVANGSEGFDVSPDSSALWTASAENGKIYIIDLSTKKLIQTIDANVRGANRLKFTPDGKMVFISSLGSGSLAIYDVKARKLIKQINIGNGAAGIVMQPDGTRAFIACTPDNYVAVIDLKTLTVVNKIDVGGEPDGLSWVMQP